MSGIEALRFAMQPEIAIDVHALYGKTAKLACLEAYLAEALALAGEGNTVVLTGAGPVWLYLK